MAVNKVKKPLPKKTSKYRKNEISQIINQRSAEKDESVEQITSETDSDHFSSDDVEEEYEKAPRVKKLVKVRNLLPVKNKKGIVYRSEIIPEETFESTPVVKVEVKKEVQRNLVQDVALQRKCLKELKRKIALLCTSLVENPENSMVALKELISMLQVPTTKMVISERKVLCLSLLHVFSDILPGYRIRAEEENTTLPRNKKEKILLKKETRKLLGYEQTLLQCYKKYLDLLYDLVRDMKLKMASKSASATEQRVAYEIGLIAVKCMCELLSTRFSFNCFKNIANKMVPLSLDGDEKVQSMCCQAFERMFKADKLGEASYNLVKQIVDVVKNRKFDVPICVLQTFLCLNLREAKPEEEKVDMRKGRKQWQAMSRSQRKDKKEIKELESELKETEAYESIESVKKFHTQTLNKLFWVFFHILKDGDKPTLISPALEGLSKFAHLINLEFFDDLNTVLCSMMESGKLSDVEKLHSVYTLFSILAGQAESLHIDPHKIYCHMYQGLLNLNHSTNVEHFILILKCLEFNIVRKKKRISLNRILAFVKRICTVSLQTPIHGSLGLLSSVRNILTNVKGSDILLDSESTYGSGLFLPEMDDPEHCNAQSTALFELQLLKKHYNPAIKLYAFHLLNNCLNQGRSSLPDKLIRSTPEEILNMFAGVAVNNQMDFLENPEPPKKKFKLDNINEQHSFEKLVDIELTSKDLDSVNFF